MTNTDIVTELRAWGANGYMVRAADEIERLREQLRLANIDAFNAAAEADTLRAERDEARKLLCDEVWLSRGGRMSVDLIARERGWDCFKEDKP